MFLPISKQLFLCRAYIGFDIFVACPTPGKNTHSFSLTIIRNGYRETVNKFNSKIFIILVVMEDKSNIFNFPVAKGNRKSVIT